MVANRRRYTRVRPRDVVAELLSAHGRSPVHLENLSRGGAFVRAERTLDVGSNVTVTLARAGARKTLALSARVTSRMDAPDGRPSRRLPGMGMQFISVGAQESTRLRALLRDLGAPDDDAELTLPPEATEAELRALEIEVPVARKPPRGGVKFELPRHLLDGVASALQEAERAPRHKPKAPPPPPPEAIAEGRSSSADRPRRITGEAQPRRGAEQQPPEVKRLLIQVRGLLMQLAEAQQRIAQRDLDLEALREEMESAADVAAAEIARLRKELASARAALDRKLQKG
ncbi:MAG TPA: PilZ domain-containing protein [Myxococcales bacterium]